MPAVVSNITVPLLGLSDTAITGHLGSEKYLAAIAVGTMMLNVVFWLFGFLRMGTTGLTATAYGASDDREVRKLFTRALLLGLAVGCLLLVMRGPLLRLMLWTIGPDDDVRAMAEGYFLICVWEAPSMLATMAVSGWFIGMQTTVWPMVIAISVNIINIMLSCLFVFVFNSGFEGVAYGTVIANWTGLAIALAGAVIHRKGRRLFCSLREIPDKDGIRRFFTVNTHLFFRSFFIISVSLGVTAVGARIGPGALAVNAVLMQFFTLFSFFMDGLAFSAEALVGRNQGAGNADGIRICVRALLAWSACVAMVFSIAYFTGSGTLTSLLTDDEGVRAGVDDMRMWVSLLPLLSVWAFIYDGFYIGMTDTGKMLLSTATASVLFFGLVLTVPRLHPFNDATAYNSFLWGSFVSYLFARGLVLALLWPREVRRLTAARPRG